MSLAVREEAWAAAIPVTLTLNPGEVTAVEGPPAPLHVLLPTVSYLPSLLPQALDHFRHVLPPEVKESVNTPWFESDGLPLRWHLPAGVLHDILYRGKPASWQVTIHFRDYPKDTLLTWDGSQSLIQAFLNSLKEAAVICAGNAASILQMSQQAQQDLWKSVESQNLSGYQRVAESLNLTPRGKGDKPPSIPVRLYLRQHPSDYMSSYEGVDYTSRPVVATKDGAVNLTLGEALQQMLPDALQLPQQQSDASEPGAESDVQAVESGSHEPVVTSRDKQQRNFKPLSDTSTVIVAGIQPSLQTSLAWLYDTLHAPDMFLYIVVITAP